MSPSHFFAIRALVKRSLLSLLTGLAFLSLLESVSDAGIVILNPSRDSSIYSENNRANGTGSLYVGRTGDLAKASAIRRSLIYFDLSSVPIGSTINSVQLRLTVAISANGTPQDLSPDTLLLHRLSTNWGEGTSRGGGANGVTPVLNDATWISSFHNTATWTNPGGDFAPIASGSKILTRPDGASTQYTFTSDPGMVSDVQDWVNLSSSNFGWLMKYEDEEALQKARGFFSRHESDVSIQPALTVDFTAVPEPGTCLLVGAAAVVLYARRFRHRRR